MLIRDYFITRWQSYVWTPNPWLVLTLLLAWPALRAYASWEAAARDGLSGGSTLLLWYGILGTGLMVFAFAVLPIHRRLANRPPQGSPRWWPRTLRPTRASWLQAHVWLSLLATLLILCHGGLGRALDRLGFGLNSVLLVVFLLTIATGLLGILLQAWLPRRLTRTIPTQRPGQVGEVPVGLVRVACRRWRREAKQLADHLQATVGAEAHQVCAERVQPLLAAWSPWRPIPRRLWRSAAEALARLRGLSDQREARAAVDLLEGILSDRRRLRQQELLYGVLHVWLFAHIACAVAAVSLTVAHVTATLLVF